MSKQSSFIKLQGIIRDNILIDAIIIEKSLCYCLILLNKKKLLNLWPALVIGVDNFLISRQNIFYFLPTTYLVKYTNMDNVE